MSGNVAPLNNNGVKDLLSHSDPDVFDLNDVP